MRNRISNSRAAVSSSSIALRVSLRSVKNDSVFCVATIILLIGLFLLIDGGLPRWVTG